MPDIGYVVVVNEDSKFPGVEKMATRTATITVNAVRDIFSRHGHPEIVVSDNEPQFIASEFQQFCPNDSTVHHTPAACKPLTNSQAA